MIDDNKRQKNHKPTLSFTLYLYKANKQIFTSWIQITLRISDFVIWCITKINNNFFFYFILNILTK